MRFPLSPSDISLWIAVMAILLLITSEFLLTSTGFSEKIIIERKRLRIIALGMGIAFTFSVVLHALEVI
jgi:hypothetical protein